MGAGWGVREVRKRRQWGRGEWAEELGSGVRKEGAHQEGPLAI